MLLLKFKKQLIFLCPLFFLLSCGIEDYPYLYPVPQSNITTEMNSLARVRIPNNNISPPFSHFAIFYRIYVSNIDELSPTSGIYSKINPTLNTDYNVFFPYVDSSTQVNTNMDSLFARQGYKYLALEGIDINSELDSDIFGYTIKFDFTSSKKPSLSIEDSSGSTINGPFNLFRSNDSGSFTPRPNRYFVNSNELWNSNNINADYNADVVNFSGIADNVKHYTYVAMYIVAVGKNDTTYSFIYSTPSLIHVFQLPD